MAAPPAQMTAPPGSSFADLLKLIFEPHTLERTDSEILEEVQKCQDQDADTQLLLLDIAFTAYNQAMLRNIHANEAEQAKLQRENEQLDQKIQTNLEWVHQVRMQTINPINKQEYITKAVRIRLGLDRESEEMESRQGKGIPQGEGRSREQEGGQVDEGGQGEEGGQGREDGQGEQDGQGREVDMVD